MVNNARCLRLRNIWVMLMFIMKLSVCVCRLSTHASHNVAVSDAKIPIKLACKQILHEPHAIPDVSTASEHRHHHQHAVYGSEGLSCSSNMRPYRLVCLIGWCACFVVVDNSIGAMESCTWVRMSFDRGATHAKPSATQLLMLCSLTRKCK